MPRKKKGNIFPGYVRVSDPNFRRLAELIVAAKGGRSMNAFAELCDVNVSTLSRVINCKITTPCSDQLIKAVAENADEQSEVTQDMLLEAHGLAKVGMMKADDSGNMRFTIAHEIGHEISHYMMQKARSDVEDASRQIIQNYLLDAGYTVSSEREQNIMRTAGIRFLADFLLTTDALKEVGIDRWAFDCHHSGSRPLMYKMNHLFGLAYLSHPLSAGLKISVVTDDEEEYADAKSRLANVCIEDEVSMVLVDIEKRCIKEEFILPKCNGAESMYVLQTKEVRSEEQKNE